MVVSLRNAARLIGERGVPDRIELRVDCDLGTCVTVEWFSSAGVSWHTFTGFSWGYCGEGPRGLRMFLSSVGVKITFQRIATMWRSKPGTVAEINRRGKGWHMAVEGEGSAA